MNNQENVSIGNWIGTLIITCIPVVNIIMLIIWAVSDNTPVSKKNWAIAQIIIMAIGIAISAVFGALFGAAIAAMFF